MSRRCLGGIRGGGASGVTTMFAIGFLAIIGVLANFVMVFALALAGLPGALIAWRAPASGSARRIAGFATALAAQAYAAGAYVAFIVHWTLLGTTQRGLDPQIFWPAAGAVAILPLLWTCRAARREAREARTISIVFDAAGWAAALGVPMFFFFNYAPGAMRRLYEWVPGIG